MGFDFIRESVDPDETEVDIEHISGNYPVLFNAEQLPSRSKKQVKISEKKPKLKKLNIKHRQMIAMHLSGVPNNSIADKIDCSVSTVNIVLRDPLAQSVISEFAETHAEEFHRLEILANASLRDALQPYKRDSVRLKAAGMFYNRKRDIGDDSTETAEDVMANLLSVINAENVQINLVNQQVVNQQVAVLPEEIHEKSV